MKTQKLKDICADIFAGATIFTNDNLSRDCKMADIERVIRLADIQDNEISFKACLFYNTSDYRKNRYLLQNNDILISSRGTIFKIAVFQKKDTHKTISSGFLTCIRLNHELNVSVNYIAAYLRHKENTIILGDKNIKKSDDKKPKIQLKLSDIYNIEIPIVSVKIQKDIDKLSQEATDYLKKSMDRTRGIEKIIENQRGYRG